MPHGRPLASLIGRPFFRPLPYNLGSVFPNGVFELADGEEAEALTRYGTAI